MKKTAWIAVALVLVIALVLTLPAICQPMPPGDDMPGGPNMGGPTMGPPPTPILVVATQGVYVVMGQQIFRLDPETLKVLAKADLPLPEPPTKPETMVKP